MTTTAAASDAEPSAWDDWDADDDTDASTPTATATSTTSTAMTPLDHWIVQWGSFLSHLQHTFPDTHTRDVDDDNTDSPRSISTTIDTTRPPSAYLTSITTILSMQQASYTQQLASCTAEQQALVSYVMQRRRMLSGDDAGEVKALSPAQQDTSTKRMLAI